MKNLFLTLTLVIVASITSFSQNTTSGVSGKLSDTKGGSLPNAVILFVHTPTGTRYEVASNDDGIYNIANMNPGGPYTATTTFIGFKTETRDNIFLKLGETQTIDVPLSEETTVLAAVVVTAANYADQTKTGAGTNVGKKQLNQLPTLSRGFSDFTKLTPQSSNNSFAGTSFRYNNITLDGAVNNDAIGFSPSLGGQSGAANQPGSSTRTSSFSLDAIQQVQVQIAPYDVTLGNFTGGSVNAVTRSGTNEIEGSVYTFGRNASITGNYTGDDKTNGGKIPDAYQDYQVGFRLGLPIIKDKLFFFTNEEITRNVTPQFFGAGSNNYFMTSAIAKQISDSLNSATFLPSSVNYPATATNPAGSVAINPNGKFNVGGYDAFSIYSNSNKFFNRLDWNINSKNQLTIRNNTVSSEATNLERSSVEFQFGSYDFLQKNFNTSTVAELKTRFSNTASNSLILGYTYITDTRNPIGNIFPNVQINNVNGGGRVLLGTNREAAIFDMGQKTFEFTDNFKFFVGKHNITLGTHNEFYNIKYGFINSWNGRIEYNSLPDFFANIPARVRAIYNPTDNSQANNLANTPASYGINFLSAYAQDDWRVIDRLKISYGLRFDYVTQPDAIPQDLTKEQAFANPAPYYGTTYTYPNAVSAQTSSIFNKLSISPRLGFNFDVDGKGSVILRGGSGVFTGRIPLAWLGYAYVNNGSTFGSIDYTNSNRNVINIPTDPTQFAAFDKNVLSAVKRVELDIIDKDFKMPQVWRSNIAADFKLGDGYKLTLEALFTKTLQDVKIQQINLRDSVKYNSYDAAQQQPVYINSGAGKNKRVSDNYSSVYLISNTQEGYRYQLTGQISKTFPFGLDLMAAYTYGESKDILNGIRNSPESGWQLNQALSPNSATLTNSNFDIRHRIIATALYKLDWNANNTSYLSFIFSSQSGTPFTWVIGSNNVTGNGQQVDLAYIPSAAGQLTFVDKIDATTKAVIETAAQQAQNFNDFVNNDSYLSSRKGNFTERNGGRTPWNNELDVRLMHDFSFAVGAKKHTIQVTLDVINIASNNVYFVPNTQNSSVFIGLTASSASSATADPKFQFTKPSATYSIDQFSSRWQGQLGVRYSF